MSRAIKVCIAWLAMSLISCGNQAEKVPDGRELVSQPAPDGRSLAFVWAPELGGLGATVSQPYQVWLQSEKGQKQQKLLFEADKTDGVRLAWTGPTELEICYESAQITRFQNFFVIAERDSPQIYRVEIILRKTQKLSDCP